MYVIVLPWPDKSLWPNSKTQHRYNGAIRNEAKQAGHLLTKNALGSRKLKGPLLIDIVFNAPNQIRRDLDNMLAATKHYLDGISIATGVDDSEWEFSIRRGEVVKGGSVTVTIKELET